MIVHEVYYDSTLRCHCKKGICNPANTKHLYDIISYNVGPTSSSTLVQRCINVTQMFCACWVQRQPNVLDVGPTLYKCYTNALCLLGRAMLWLFSYYDTMSLKIASLTWYSDSRCV